MTQPNIYVLEGGTTNQVQRIISQIFLLKSDMNFIRQFFYQTEFKPIRKRKFETSKTKGVLNIRHVIS
jgi:hypothetical protein